MAFGQVRHVHLVNFALIRENLYKPADGCKYSRTCAGCCSFRNFHSVHMNMVHIILANLLFSFLEFPYFVTNLAQTFLTKIQLEKWWTY
jgi:hypothetical protein